MLSIGRAAATRLTLFAPIVGAIDRRLRRRLDVRDYSDAPECVFRFQIVTSKEDFVLPDGVRVRAGDRILDLHFWNEQVPRMPSGAPTIGFARLMARRIDGSLAELAAFLDGRDDLRDIRAIRANLGLGANDRADQIAGLAARFGFRRAGVAGPGSLAERLHRFGENILITMLVMARNPGAVRSDTLRRGRTLTYLSRAALEQRYRSCLK